MSPEKAEAKDWMPQNQERRVASSEALYHVEKYNRQEGIKPASVMAIKIRIIRYPP